MLNNINVAFIGLDGWGSFDFCKSLDQMPHVRQFCKDGVIYDNKTSVLPTKSAPNWASLFMGVNPDVHGFKSNTNELFKTCEAYLEQTNCPSIFQIVKSSINNSRIGLFYQWKGLLNVIDRNTIDRICRIPLICNYSHSLLTSRVTKYINKTKPVFCAVIFDDPDYTGHKYGFFSEVYYSKLRLLDNCVFRIVRAYHDAGIYENTVFVITGDHGGKGREHGGESLNEMKTPLIIWGKGVNITGYNNDVIDQQDVAVTLGTVVN